jgi:hypothetical protein
MSARKPREVNISAAPALAALPLTEAEQALLAMFRATDDRGRLDMAMMARCVIKCTPSQKKASLRLVVGGAS